MVIQNGYEDNNDELLRLAQPTVQPTAQTATPDWSNVKNQLLQQWGGINPQYMQGTLKQSGMTMDQLADQFAQQAYKAGITDLSKLKLGTDIEKYTGDAINEFSPETALTYDIKRNYLTFGDGDDAKKIGYVGAGEGRDYLDDPDALNRAMYAYAYKDKPADSLGRLFGTAEGGGWTSGEVVRGADGQLMIVPKWGESSDKDELLKAAQVLLTVVPGAGQGLGALVGQGLSPALQAALGNALIGGTMSELGGGNFLRGAVTGGAGAMLTPALGSLGESAAGALGAQGATAEAIKNAVSGAGRSAFGAAVSGNSIADALLSGGLSGAATGALRSTVGDLKLPSTITDPLAAAATAALTGKNVDKAAANALLGALMKGAREGTIKNLPGDLGEFDFQALESLQEMDPLTAEQFLRDLGLQDYDFSGLDRDLSGDYAAGDGNLDLDFVVEQGRDGASVEDFAGNRGGFTDTGDWVVNPDVLDINDILGSTGGGNLEQDFNVVQNRDGAQVVDDAGNVGFFDNTGNWVSIDDLGADPGRGNLEQDFHVVQNRDGAQVVDDAGNRGYFDNRGNFIPVTGEDPNELRKIMTEDTVTGGAGKTDQTKTTGGGTGSGENTKTQTPTSDPNNLFALLAMLGMFGDNGGNAPQQPALMDLSGVKSIQDIFGDYFTKRG